MKRVQSDGISGRKFSANKSISMGRRSIELARGDETFKARTTPKLRLLPRPQLIIDVKVPYSGFFFDLDTFGSFVDILPQRERLKVIPASVTAKNGSASCSLVASVEPSTVLATRKKLRRVNFAILNFPEFFGGHDVALEDDDGGVCRLGATEIVTEDWQASVTSLPNLKDLVQSLKLEGGYSVTHVGSVHRADLRLFTVEEVSNLLEGLRLYLSFARGAFCSLTLQEGFDQNGDKAWEQWGSNSVAPWGYNPSWFDRMNGSLLGEIFPGFWAMLNDPAWEDAIRTALYWYLRSNSPGSGPGIDGGLILTQAALERLSFSQLSRTHSPVSRQITAALESMSIPTNIPRSCRSLRTLARNHRWQNGPHAISEVRNELVHPRDKYGREISSAYYEAWNLGQRYIELMLLRLFGHRGLHANRLTQRWRGEVVRVPWA